MSLGPRSKVAHAWKAAGGMLAAFCMLWTTGCSGSAGVQIGTKDSTTNPLTGQEAAVPAGLEDYYSQKINWGNCPGVSYSGGRVFDCAKVKVPKDYENPQGEQLTITIGKLEASVSDEEKLGTLFINPGGPGGSGIDFLISFNSVGSTDLLANYDIVGFDPRGVSRSTPLRCRTDQQIDQDRADSTLVTDPDGIQKMADSMQQLGQLCQEASGDLLNYLGTEYAAQDLDILRAVEGQTKLAYLGFSYGSYLGITYAKLFPQNVGRMVLDGILSPNYSYAQVSQLQAVGFENAYKNFANWCSQSEKSCPFSSVEQGVEKLQQLFDQLKAEPLATNDPDRPLTRSLAEEGVVGLLYFESTYAALKLALTSAFNGDGSSLLSYADQLSSREDNGTYSDNSSDAFLAINEADYLVEGTEEDWNRRGDALLAAAPLLGPSMAYGEYALASWPYHPSTSRQIDALTGVAPILLIGNTNDPATPYEMATDVHQWLENSVLVTLDSYSHTAYGDSVGSGCVNDAVDQYLIQGQLPEGDLTCSG